MREALEIKEPIQLLVEGRDSQVFMQALLRHRSLALQVHDFGGVTELRRFLKAFVLAPNFRLMVTKLAIIRDAEVSFASACQSVNDALVAAGLPAPSDVGRMEPGNPSVGFFVLPDCGGPGMLETLCLNSVRSDPAMECVHSYFHCLQTSMPQMPNNLDKAKAQAFWLRALSLV